MTQERERSSLGARPLRMILPGAVAALCLVVIVYLATEVRTKLDELASSPADNMQWTLSQLEVEFLEFARAVDHAALLPADVADADTKDALADLRKRYNILYSRFDTLSSGRMYARSLRTPEMAGRFGEAKEAITGLVPLIDGPDDALLNAAPRLRDMIEELRDPIRAVLTIGNQMMVEQSVLARQDVARVLYRLALASLVLLLALTLLMMMFRQLAVLNERRAKEILTTSARLTTIVSTSRDSILVLDGKGRIETANEAAEAMFGDSGANLSGRPIGTFLSRASGKRLQPLAPGELRALCASTGKAGQRLVARHAKGETFPVELSMDVTDREGTEVFVCVIRDISHQIAAEAELKSSRDKALAGERAKARFLGVVSHEMRTPLNGLIGTVELMQSASEDEIRRDYLPVLRNSGQILLDLVNDVLDLTQIEGGGRSETAPFDIDALIDSVLDAERPRAQANGNRLVREGAAPQGWAAGDERRIRQVLLNLVSNAVKFTRDGRIGVSAERHGDETVEFRVTDTGFGISATDLAHIFEDFVRTDAALDRQVQGTGLGLGIARQLARGMGGDIEASSEEGTGSEFRLTLPLPAVATPARSSPVPKADGPSSTPVDEMGGHAPPQPLSILMAEDNATNRFVARRMLDRLGHEIIEAHDGLCAVEAAGKRDFDLILMDVSMPEIDGLEATRRIRAGDGPNADTPIVALTAHVGEDIAAAVEACGMDGLLTKPLDRHELCRVLDDMSENHAHASDCAHSPTGSRTRKEPLLDPSRLRDIRAAAGAERTARQIDGFLAQGRDLFADPSAICATPETADAIHVLSGSAAILGAGCLGASLNGAEAAARAGREDALRRRLRRCAWIWEATAEAVLTHYPRDISPAAIAAGETTTPFKQPHG